MSTNYLPIPSKTLFLQFLHDPRNLISTVNAFISWHAMTMVQLNSDGKYEFSVSQLTHLAELTQKSGKDGVIGE